MPHNDLYFRVADATFRVHLTDIDDARSMLPSYAPFHQPDGCGEEELLFTMTVSDGAVPFVGRGTELGRFDCGDIVHNVFRTDDEGYRILMTDMAGRRRCAMDCGPQFRHCTATLYDGPDACPTEMAFGLGNALMLAFAFAGAYHNILLMHSSVTMVGDDAYLFLGTSGTGKSTHSTLWRRHIEGADLLNDDNPAVRVDADGGVWVYGTPWSGKTPCYRNLRRSAKALVRLQQWPENVMHRLPAVAAFAEVVSSSSVMMWDKPSYDGIIATATAVVQRVPVFHLKCLPDAAAARLCRDTIAAAYGR